MVSGYDEFEYAKAALQNGALDYLLKPVDEDDLSLRMKRAKELLGDQDLQIQEIAERLGYSNRNYFSKAFKNYFHIAPSEYRERA